MTVLVDTSAWVDYFRGARRPDRMDWLIDQGLIVTNDLILAELLPRLLLMRQKKLAALLESIPLLSLRIDWKQLVKDQLTCLKNGINKVGIPDLIIAQNARQHAVSIYSHDKHFVFLSQPLGVDLF